MFCWGSTVHGELGLGGIEEEHILTPRALDWSLAGTVIEAALGENHTLLLTRDGKIYSCGNNDYGQLGHDQPRKRPRMSFLKLVSGMEAHSIIHVACGSMHSMALNQWGQVFTWGSDYHGQLGQSLGENVQPIPKMVRALATYHIIQICCGQRHSVALANTGEVLTWGANSFGQLGLGTCSQTEIMPTVVKSLNGLPVAFIACGANHTFAVSKSGAVYGWGKNRRGQLGLNDTDNKVFPTQLRTLRAIRVRYISCGEEFSIFLTLDGGVFTCGAGMFGQLGHGTNFNEILPRQVIELMGSTITQVASGRQHSLALVPSRGRVYSFGIGGSGQLGLRKATSASTPQVVLGPWVSPSGMSLVPTSSDIKNLVIQRIYAGGDHCFVSVIKQESKVPPYDCREIDPQTQILSISYDYIKNLLRIPCDNPVDQDVLTYLETVFKSLSCINGSFLLDDDRHYYCSSKHHGVDIAVAEATFSLIGRIENKSITELTAFYDSSLVAMLDILALLNKINHTAQGLKIPYITFHMNDLSDYLDVRVDYVNWLSNQRTGRLFLCNYPFVFDAKAKTQLLEVDQSIQMQTAMSSAARQAFVAMLVGSQNSVGINSFLVLNISREHIVQDALRELSQVNPRDLKKPLKVKFHDEEAEDAGGVTKEFFLLLLREILDPKYGMFKEYEETRAIWFSENSFEDDDVFFLIGMILGLAIYNYTIIDVPFPLALYKKLLGEVVNLNDLGGLSPILANSLLALLNYENDDFQEVFDLTFEISRDVFGEIVTIPLKENGKNIAVNQENKQEYVDLYVNYIFHESVKQQYQSFHTGFMKVCDGRVLQLFHSQELMAVVVGNEDYDWHALEEAAEYKNGYKSSDEPIRWFWEVIHEMSLADKKKFLLFLTGSCRIPIQGMKGIKIYIQPTNDDKFLPVAHTCFNLLDLPRYKTKERLKYKLMQAIQQTEGFSLV
ncbi:HECT and RLD domain containing E3 ubiquitin ligase 4 isoform X3 [Leptinotarsa decemlineata]|uniref:HECT and RLD domain containing E3 ubiquitin ligase 4 isoform X3 n=1 Tax=Leptinotarsa decemlineata TaxID=7539 RepID=UPI003D309F12